ncbi:regulatory protein, LuxR [Fulvivirga imtechensis AK7]|uniref:Regulatory protein, LuxR n=1 Tax=Fulvivirga imtechensis AK7 TaxID=1237149 RepID=L8JHH5_9BACT|nr:regulatory protein, LuxR [Fulvivirga imtechensis AK7]
MEYRYFVRDLSLEVYLAVIASLFTALGVWAGAKLIKKTKIQQPGVDFAIDSKKLEETGISTREYEVLELMAQGHSNQEIADKLFVSLSTIKTHTTNLFSKLDVKRRTQAVQRAKELNLIP